MIPNHLRTKADDISLGELTVHRNVLSLVLPLVLPLNMNEIRLLNER